MEKSKNARLKRKGWKIGSAAEFLQLSPEEARYIELKMALGASLRAERRKRKITQVELASLLGSSQSRVAKMEAGDPSVSVDLLLKALLRLGVTNRELGRLVAGSRVDP